MKRKKAKSGSSRNVGSSQLHHHHHGPSAKKVVIKTYDETPNRFRSKIDPLNLEEQKLQFLKHGQVPHFQFKVAPEKIEELAHTKRAEIEFDLLDVAVRILEQVRQKYGTGSLCVEQMFGERITAEKASRKLSCYLQQNGADGLVTLGWAKDLACSAKMAWCGPSMKANKPEARKYSLWLKDSTENMFLREKGIICLADHEIGTHFFRTLNDGIQPWFSNREQFGLKKIRSHHLKETEEGLATINTLVQASQKLLWIPALIYYTACKASSMSFEELFAHLGHFLENRELRWRYVMRVKRSLPDPAGVGGYGNDQCYFKGAVEILQNLDKIDFHLLYAGKVCVESLPRIRRMARLDCIRLPHFMQDMAAYMKTLRSIAAVNGLNLPSKSSTLSKGIGQRRRSKKSKSGGSKRRKRSASKPNVEEEPAIPSDDEDERDCLNLSGDIRDDSDDGGDVIFYRTYDHSATLSATPCLSKSDTEQPVGKSKVSGTRSPSKKSSSPNTQVRRCLSKSFVHSPNDDAESKEPLFHASQHLSDLHLSHKSRSQSQPSIMSLYEDSQSNSIPSHALTPPPSLTRPIPPLLAPLSMKKVAFPPGGTAPRRDSTRLSPTKPSTSPQSKFKWGIAERAVSPLLSTMPNVSSRYNREKSDSPVPFSPHRWLLWRREKSSPNTLNS